MDTSIEVHAQTDKIHTRVPVLSMGNQIPGFGKSCLWLWVTELTLRLNRCVTKSLQYKHTADKHPADHGLATLPPSLVVSEARNSQCDWASGFHSTRTEAAQQAG